MTERLPDLDLERRCREWLTRMYGEELDSKELEMDVSSMLAFVEGLVEEARRPLEEVWQERLKTAATRMYSAAAVLKQPSETYRDDPRIGAVRKLLIETAREVDQWKLELGIVRPAALAGRVSSEGRK